MVLILERSIGLLARRDCFSFLFYLLSGYALEQLYEPYAFLATTEHYQVARLWRTVHSEEASTKPFIKAMLGALLSDSRVRLDRECSAVGQHSE